MTVDAITRERLRGEVQEARWYHSMELPGGIVTPGDYDLPDTARRIPIPASLQGRRCLDVGTRDGFWAFEMERRGASEVIGIDLDDPSELDFPGIAPALGSETRESLDRRDSTFSIAHRALESRVERRNLSVYDLDPDDIGRFDFAFIGTLLLHLRNPVDALKAIRGVLRPDGLLMSNDPVSVPLSILRPRQPSAEIAMESPRPFWWIPNAAGRERMVTAAGYEIVSSGRPYLMRYGAGWEHQRAPRSPALMAQWLVLRRGAPHTWIIARPAA
ncbi:MAG: methyltransferase domain-containing protein [Thermoleophilaceae bacterium]